MTTETKINIRIDKKTKDEAKKTLEALGLDLSSGVKLFLKSVINTQSIPFDVRTKNGYTIDQEEALLQETQETQKTIDGVRSGAIQTHDDVDGFMKSLL